MPFINLLKVAHTLSGIIPDLDSFIGGGSLIAFHKKGCPLCIEQQKALNTVYKDSSAKDLKVLVVDYDNDTMNLKNFNVGQQGTLILYEGNTEISRTMGSKDPAAILSQIKG